MTALPLQASDSSPYMTFVAGGAYVNDSNQGRWGATQNRGTTGPYSVLVGTDAASISFKVRSWPGHVYRFRVDGEYVTDVNSTVGPGDGSQRYLVDEAQLMATTRRLGATLLDPLKTTVVQDQRCMTTWVARK